MVRALASLSLLALAAVVVAADPPLRATPLGDANTAARWAAQLGDRDYQTREQASKELDALGEAALPALEKVLTAGNPEAVRRAAAVIARIQARAENARAIAAKRVDVDIDDQPFGTALAELQKQTGYQIRVNGDQAVLGKKGTFSAKKESFWTALDRLAAELGLEVESAAGYAVPVNVNRDYAAELQLRQRQVERDLLQQQIQRAKVAVSVLQNQEAAVAKKLAALTGDEKKVKGPGLEKEREALKAQAARSREEVAELEKRFSASVAAPPPAGTVVLRTVGTGKPSPSVVVGAVRVQAVPFGGQPEQVSREVIPLVLTATPEPSLRWVRTTETIITKAVTPDGRVLSYDPTAVSAGAVTGYDRVEQLQIPRLRVRRLRESYLEPVVVDTLGGFTPSHLQALVRLHAPTAGAAVTKLATVEGVMRAKVWSQPEAVVGLKGLTADPSRVTGMNSVSLEAKLTADPHDKAAHYLDLVLTYDPTEVSPQGDGPAADPLYFEQAPGGGARPIRPRPRAAVSGNPHGLTLTDDTGGAYTMSLQTGETIGLGYDPYTGINRQLRLKQRYIVRAAKSDSGPPSRLTFSAVRMREVDLPFKLTDVPVAAGTADPKLVTQPAAMQLEAIAR